MCDLYEAVNNRTAVSFRRLFGMLSVLWRFSFVWEAGKVGIAQRSDIRKPFKLIKPNLNIFITLTAEQKPLNVFREPLKTSLTANFLRLCTSSALAIPETHQVFTSFRRLESVQSTNENLLVFWYLKNHQRK